MLNGNVKKPKNYHRKSIHTRGNNKKDTDHRQTGSDPLYKCKSPKNYYPSKHGVALLTVLLKFPPPPVFAKPDRHVRQL